MFFFFKQKTAYEMRIGDWSSDVCSSDLLIVDEKLYEPLIETLNKLVARLIVGEPHADPAPFMGCVIDNDAADQLTESFLALMMRGGRPIRHLERPIDDRPFLSPALTDTPHMAERPDIELFGPVPTVLRAHHFDPPIPHAPK